MTELIEDYKEKKFKHHFLKWLRWIGVLPCSVIAYFVSYALVRGTAWVSEKLYDFGENGWYVLYVVPAIAAGFSGYAFVYFGKLISPFYKKETGFVLLILLTMLMGVGIFVGTINGHAMTIIEGIATVVGAVVGLFDEENN